MYLRKKCTIYYVLAIGKVSYLEPETSNTCPLSQNFKFTCTIALEPETSNTCPLSQNFKFTCTIKLIHISSN
jgi:hypothetical protein